MFTRHFYNPGQITGVVDSGTKYTVVYTETERPKTITMLSLGTGALDIPVGATLYPQRVTCPSDCMDRLGDATAISVRFHMHDWGRMVILRHVRAGQELEPIA